ncbi:Uncharacterised protein [Bacillus freudenreichii]|nr:Uncharacterised protein [Bacillus freudenreichii]
MMYGNNQKEYGFKKLSNQKVETAGLMQRNVWIKIHEQRKTSRLITWRLLEHPLRAFSCFNSFLFVHLNEKKMMEGFA